MSVNHKEWGTVEGLGLLRDFGSLLCAGTMHERSVRRASAFLMR